MKEQTMKRNQEWWNPILQVVMRITSAGILERLESSIATAGRGAERHKGRKFIPVVDRHLSKNWKKFDATLRNKRDLIEQLVDELFKDETYKGVPQIPYEVREKDKRESEQEGIPVTPISHTDYSESEKAAWGNPRGNRYAVKQRLRHLSPLSIFDAFEKLSQMPESQKDDYKDFVHNFIGTTHVNHMKQYPTELTYRENKTTKGIRVSKINKLECNYTDGDEYERKAVMAGPNNKSGITGYVSVHHPQAGQLLFFQKDKKWEAFDGIAHNQDGHVVFDIMRSRLLSKNSFAPHIKKIQTLLNKSNDDLSYGETITVTPEDFNTKHTPFTHVPTDATAQEHYKHLDTFLKHSGGAIKETNKDVLRDPRVAYALFNDISKIDPSNITNALAVMRDNLMLPVGHSDLIGNPEPLLDVIGNRNLRGDDDTNKWAQPHPVTEYKRPITTAGQPVPYKAMTGDEKADYRKHWDNLYGRSESWLRHTEKGKQLYDLAYKQVKTHFDSEGGIEQLRMDAADRLELVNAFDPDHILGVNDDNTLSGDGLTGVIKGMTIRDIIKNYNERDENNVPLSEHLDSTQKSLIAKIRDDRQARLAFGVVDDVDAALAEQFKDDTLNRLLGHQIIPSSRDYEDTRKAGLADTGIMLIDGKEIPEDSLYKQRRGNGLLDTEFVDDHNPMHKRFVIKSKGQIIDNESGELIVREGEIPDVPRDISEYGKDGDSFPTSLRTYLGDSVIDQFVRDGYFPQEYASNSSVVPSQIAPEAPEFGSPEALKRVNFVSELVRDYDNIRGHDNEDGLYPYEIDEDDELAEMAKVSSSKGSHRIVDIIYEQAMEEEGLVLGQRGYVRYSPTEAVLDGIENGGEMPPSDDDESEISPRLKESRYSLAIANELQVQHDEATDPRVKRSLAAQIAEFRGLGADWQAHVAQQELNDDPLFQAYKEKVRMKQASEVLQNAPVNVRATAFRMRLQGIEERMSTATTMGEVHDLARELIRVGVVEHRDMIAIDRDGTSKLRQISRRLEDAGADFTVVDKELQDRTKVMNDRKELIASLREDHALLMGSGLVPDPASKEEWTPQEHEAWNRLTGLHANITKLEQDPPYSFGSAEHVNQLKTNVDTADAYRMLDSAQIGAEGADALNNYKRIKDLKNVVADSFAAGMNQFNESKLLGNNSFTSMIQAVMSTIGEGTGYGADRIRGMKVDQPIDQMRADMGGSWQDWIKGPGTVEAWRTKQEGLQGRVYSPDPSAEDPEFASVLETTGGRVNVDAPRYDPDTQAPQTDATEDPITPAHEGGPSDAGREANSTADRMNDASFKAAREARQAEPAEQPQAASKEKRDIRNIQGQNIEVKSSMGKPPERKAPESKDPFGDDDL
jgi:hypothetical protein